MIVNILYFDGWLVNLSLPVQRRFSEDYLIAKLIKVSFKMWMSQTCFSLMARKGICSVAENLVMIACMWHICGFSNN
jgi:hypothetical protein